MRRAEIVSWSGFMCATLSYMERDVNALDVDGFLAAVGKRVKKLGLRKVADGAGVDAGNLSRFLASPGGELKAETFMRLCRWMGVVADEFMVDSGMGAGGVVEDDGIELPAAGSRMSSVTLGNLGEVYGRWVLPRM